MHMETVIARQCRTYHIIFFVTDVALFYFVWFSIFLQRGFHHQGFIIYMSYVQGLMRMELRVQTVNALLYEMLIRLGTFCG